LAKIIKLSLQPKYLRIEIAVVLLITVLSGLFFSSQFRGTTPSAGSAQQVLWDSQEDFINNASTTSEVTTIKDLEVTSNGVSLSALNQQSNGSDGELIVDGTNASLCTWKGSVIAGGPFNSDNPLVLDTNQTLNAGRSGVQTRVWNFSNVTLQNGAVLTHSGQAGGQTEVEGVEIRASSTVAIDNSSKIDVTGKGFIRGSLAIPGTTTNFGGPGSSKYVRGGGYGATGGATGVGSYFESLCYGSPAGVEYLGSSGGYRLSSGSDNKTGRGGGRVKIVASNVEINGSIQANGEGGNCGDKTGGGSGGGILIYSNDVQFNGIISAAGGGGAGSSYPNAYGAGQDGKDGSGGKGGGPYGGNGGAPGVGGNGGAGAGWGNQGSSGGSSAGGGGTGWDGGGGGAAGRIAVYYNKFNNGLVNAGTEGYSVSPTGTIGPYAYFVKSPSTGNRYISRGDLGTWAARPFEKRGLIFDSGAGKANSFKRFIIDASNLTDDQTIKWQVRAAKNKELLNYEEYVGPDNTGNTWFDASNQAQNSGTAPIYENWVQTSQPDFNEGQTDNTQVTQGGDVKLGLSSTANTITKQAIADNWINQYSGGWPAVNRGSDNTLIVGDLSNDTYRSALRFDFSEDIPQQASINSAILSLYYYRIWPWDNFSYSNDKTLMAHRCIASWSESAPATSILGSNAYVSEYAAAIGVPSAYGWIDWDVKNQVQYDLDNLSGEANFLIKFLQENNSTPCKMHFISKDNSGAYQPKLTISYSLPSYVLSGTYLSSVKDVGNNASYGNLNWKANTQSGTSITMQVRAGNSPDISDGSWIDVINGGSLLALNGKRYIQYKATLTTDDANKTPLLQEVYADIYNQVSTKSLNNAKVNFSLSNDSRFIEVRFKLESKGDGSPVLNRFGIEYEDIQNRACGDCHKAKYPNDEFDKQLENNGISTAACISCHLYGRHNPASDEGYSTSNFKTPFGYFRSRSDAAFNDKNLVSNIHSIHTGKDSKGCGSDLTRVNEGCHNTAVSCDACHKNVNHAVHSSSRYNDTIARDYLDENAAFQSQRKLQCTNEKCHSKGSTLKLQPNCSDCHYLDRSWHEPIDKNGHSDIGDKHISEAFRDNPVGCYNCHKRNNSLTSIHQNKYPDKPCLICHDYGSFDFSGSNSGGGKWTKRKPINIDNFMANVQAKIELNFLPDMKSDFSDIRFYDDTAKVELPYFIEKKEDSVSATVWFMTGSNNSVYMYYGNSSATSSSSSDKFYTIPNHDFENGFGGSPIAIGYGEYCCQVIPNWTRVFASTTYNATVTDTLGYIWRGTNYGGPNPNNDSLFHPGSNKQGTYYAAIGGYSTSGEIKSSNFTLKQGVSKIRFLKGGTGYANCGVQVIRVSDGAVVASLFQGTADTTNFYMFEISGLSSYAGEVVYLRAFDILPSGIENNGTLAVDDFHQVDANGNIIDDFPSGMSCSLGTDSGATGQKLNPEDVIAGIFTGLDDQTDTAKCTECHKENLTWEEGHSGVDHTYSELPTFCSNCHGTMSEQIDVYHTQTLDKGYDCFTCHDYNGTKLDKNKIETAIDSGNKACNACHDDLSMTDGHQNIDDAHTYSPGVEDFCKQCHTQNTDINVLNKFHLNTLNKGYDCFTCHNYSGTKLSKARIDAAIDSGNKECSACHDDLDMDTGHTNYQSKHVLADPLWTITCNECHQTNELTDLHINKFVDFGKSYDCFTCHNYQGTKLNKAVIDNAIQNNDKLCSACHTTFDMSAGHTDPPLTQRHTSEAFRNNSVGCYNCHKEDKLTSIHENKYPQNPCLICHKYEGTKLQNDDVKGGIRVGLADDTDTAKCTECHKTNLTWDEGHAGIDHSYSEFPQFCQGCHGQISTGIDAYHTQTLSKGYDCFTCHDYNGDKLDKQKVETAINNGNKACNACHDDLNMETGHQNVGANHTFAPIPQGCINCHNSFSGRYGLGISVILSDYHSTQGFDCFTCHNYQGTKLNKQVIDQSIADGNKSCGNQDDGQGGQIAGCHSVVDMGLQLHPEIDDIHKSSTFF